MTKLHWHMFAITLIVVVIPFLFGLLSGFPFFGAMLFDVLGGGLLFTAARFQPDFQYLTPLLAWRGNAQEISRRRWLLGSIGFFLMLLPILMFVGFPLLPDRLVDPIFALWPVWLVVVPLLVIILAFVLNRRITQDGKMEVEAASMRRVHPQPARLRTIGVTFLTVLSTQVVLQFVARRWGWDVMIITAAFALGVIGLLSVVFWKPLERWLPPVTNYPPPPAMMRRQRWLVALSGVFGFFIAFAAITDLLDRDLISTIFWVGVVVSFALMMIDYWGWRVKKALENRDGARAS